jgi:hypothetical protein
VTAQSTDRETRHSARPHLPATRGAGAGAVVPSKSLVAPKILRDIPPGVGHRLGIRTSQPQGVQTHGESSVVYL